VVLACGSAPTAPTTTANTGGTVPGPPSITSLDIGVVAPLQVVPLLPPLRPHIWAAVGQSAPLTAIANGTTDVTRLAEWTVNSTDYATVTSGGLLTALRAGTVSLRASFGGRTVTSFLTIFRAPATTTQSFSHRIAPGERRPYFVTVGAGGGDVVVILASAEAAFANLGLMFGSAIGNVCSPPYTWGVTFFSTAFAGGVEANAKGATYPVSPGRYCVVVLDPGAVTGDDKLSPTIPSALMQPMTAPASYAVTIGASGAGASVVSN